MKKLIDFRRKEPYYEGEIITEYYSEDGGHTDSAEHFLQIDRLGFCCCGAPRENLIYILKGLSMVDDKIDESISWSDGCKKQMDKLIEHFGSETSKSFFYYWADKEGYTEHGSGMGFGGWLTDKGKELIQMINDYLELENENKN